LRPATNLSERKRAERLTERAERNLFAANAATIGSCPAYGLMILREETSTRARGQLYHEGCTSYVGGDGSPDGSP
jgi:hypothetical protein